MSYINDGVNLDSINNEDNMTLSKELLDIIACPKCKGKIYLNEKEDGLICENCRLLFEVRDGIPVMLIDEAKKIQDCVAAPRGKA